MKPRAIFLLVISPFVVVIGLIFIDFEALVLYLAEQATTIKNNISGFAAVVSVGLYVKLRFWDTRTIHKMQTAYGKEKFLEALDVTCYILSYISPDEFSKRVLSISNIDIEMRKEICRLSRIVDGETVPVKPKRPEMKLDRDTRKALKMEIGRLLKIINKRIDLHSFEKDGIISEKFTEVLDRWRRKRKIYDTIDEKLRESGRKKVRRFHGK